MGNLTIAKKIINQIEEMINLMSKEEIQKELFSIEQKEYTLFLNPDTTEEKFVSLYIKDKLYKKYLSYFESIEQAIFDYFGYKEKVINESDTIAQDIEKNIPVSENYSDYNPEIDMMRRQIVEKFLKQKVLSEEEINRIKTIEEIKEIVLKDKDKGTEVKKKKGLFKK